MILVEYCLWREPVKPGSFCRVMNRARPRLGARIGLSSDLALMFLSRTCLPDCVPVPVSIGKVWEER